MKFTLASADIAAGSSFQKNFPKVLCKAAGRKIGAAKNAINNRVAKGHTSAYDAIQHALTVGFQNPRSGGQKPFSFRTKIGYIQFTTRSWEPLTTKYANSSPVSTVFWRKHPVQPGHYRKGNKPRFTLLTLFSWARIESTKARSTNTKQMQTRRRCYISWDVLFTVPNNVLNRIISEPFISGVDSDQELYIGGERISGIVPDEDNVSMILWVEGERPFVKDLSFRVGKKLGADIKNELLIRSGARAR